MRALLVAAMWEVAAVRSAKSSARACRLCVGGLGGVRCVLSDDELTEGLRRREESRQARLRQAEAALQVVAIADQRAEEMYNETYYMRERYEAIQRLGRPRPPMRLTRASARTHVSAGIVQVINWAYRGKHPHGDPKAWTGERHLLSGIRTTEAAMDELLARCDRLGAQQESLLVAMRDDPQSGQEVVVGTIHVRRASDNDAELGMFAVDPDLQGEGIGNKLLLAAVELARREVGATRAIMWCISVRNDLIGWYQSKGFRVVDGETMMFPVDAGVGEPLSSEPLQFVKLEKLL